jgi:hypothetical protein
MKQIVILIFAVLLIKHTAIAQIKPLALDGFAKNASIKVENSKAIVQVDTQKVSVGLIKQNNKIAISKNDSAILAKLFEFTPNQIATIIAKYNDNNNGMQNAYELLIQRATTLPDSIMKLKPSLGNTGNTTGATMEDDFIPENTPTDKTTNSWMPIVWPLLGIVLGCLLGYVIGKKNSPKQIISAEEEANFLLENKIPENEKQYKEFYERLKPIASKNAQKLKELTDKQAELVATHNAELSKVNNANMELQQSLLLLEKENAAYYKKVYDAITNPAKIALQNKDETATQQYAIQALLHLIASANMALNRTSGSDRYNYFNIKDASLLTIDMMPNKIIDSQTAEDKKSNELLVLHNLLKNTGNTSLENMAHLDTQIKNI